MENEKENLVKDFIKLQSQYQQTYFNLQESERENKQLKTEINKIKTEKIELEKRLELLQTTKKPESNFGCENNRLQAKVKQLMRDSLPKTPLKTKNEVLTDLNESGEYEVDCLIGHKKKNGKYIFLVRWKGFSSTHDSWLSQRDLKCPALLKEYIKKHNL